MAWDLTLWPLLIESSDLFFQPPMGCLEPQEEERKKIEALKIHRMRQLGMLSYEIKLEQILNLKTNQT